MKKVKRKLFNRFALIPLLVIVVVVLAGVIYQYKNRPLCTKCNVILIALDTLGAQHMPCYGYTKNTSPNLCAFAKENILFSNAYSHSPMSLQSHFSVITSLYPYQHKITESFKDPLDKEFKTLAEVLQTNGYKTIYNGQLNDPHYPLNRGAERGFDIIEERKSENSKDDIGNWDKSLKRLKDNIKTHTPTFLFLQTYYVHDPYLPGHTDHPFTNLPEYPNIAVTEKEFHQLSIDFFKSCYDYVLKEKGTLSKIVIDNLEIIGHSNDFGKSYNIFINLPKPIQTGCLKNWYIQNINLNDPNQRDYFEAMYDEQILRMDDKLSKLFKFLSDPEVAKSTIVVIDGVHAEEFMEHGEWGHSNNLYITSVQVPLIMRIPGLTGVTVKNLVQGIDIYPTILSLVGIKPMSKIQGIDLTALMLGRKSAQTNKFVFSQWKNKAAIQTDRWRFYYNSNKKPLELYDLINDKGEKINVLKQHPEAVREFLKMLPN